MANDPRPPKLAQWLLIRFLRDELAEEVMGDLEEKFEAVAMKRSVWRAKARYWYEVFHYLRPFAIRKSTGPSLHYTDMLQHIFLLSFRGFLRHKSSFFINLTGLSTGLACALLIYLWVSDELRIDRFHENDNRLYEVMEHRIKGTGVWTANSASGLMAESLAADMPEVETAVSSSNNWSVMLSVGDKNMKVPGRFVSKDYFTIFSYELLQGNRNSVLENKSSIVISDKVAIALFGSVENSVGKNIEYEHNDQYTVSGVFKSLPSYSSENFDFLISYEKFKEGRPWLLSWYNTSVHVYLLLRPGVSADEINRKIANYIKIKTNNEVTHRTPFVVKYSDGYLYGKYENGIQAGGRITNVKLFSVIAVFLLLTASINFMNLSTARASRRAKEIGIKKTVGANRNGLIVQYLGESIIITFLSLAVAVLLVMLFLPQFNIITGKHLTFSLTLQDVAAILGITFLTGLISGSYPALYLSALSAATVLKGKLTTSISELVARKGLVIFQFTLSIIFIASILVIYRQIQFIQSGDRGYDRDNIILFELTGALRDTQKQETLIGEMKNVPGVENASSISNTMTGHNAAIYGLQWEGYNPNDKTEFENFTVNYEMIETLGMKMAAGRSFSKEYSMDTAKIIFNEAAIRFMGLEDPIGKVVKLWGKDRQIIGIVKDFNFESVHDVIKPAFFRLDPNDTYLMMVKLSDEHQKETLDLLTGLYQKINPGFIFDYSYLDTNYQALYTGEQKLATLSSYFAGLVVLISCLGLFGLAAFTAERRVKEIGIRKVLGASVMGIIYILSVDFTGIVFAAILIAVPVSYFIATAWLNTFAFRVSLQWWYFVVPALTALFIAWLTVGLQALKAAKVNPVKSLKIE